MASLLSPASAAASLPQNPLFPYLSYPKPFSPIHLNPSPTPSTRRSTKCNAITSEELVEIGLHLAGSNPWVSKLEALASGLPEVERWEILVVFGIAWVYLTARPGVLMGAVDAYFLAPLQLGLDGLLGRRNLKMNDFIVGERLGEGTFGVVYAGVIVPKNVSMEDRVGRRSMRVQIDERFKQKVILKKVKVGTAGAEECGDFEEWFNYRVSRAAPESCAEFLGTFVADKTSSEFVKGGKWLVWKFEPCDREIAP